MEPQIKSFEERCDYCMKPGSMACSGTNFKGIVLLVPDEMWICEDCLARKKRRIIIGADI